MLTKTISLALTDYLVQTQQKKKHNLQVLWLQQGTLMREKKYLVPGIHGGVRVWTEGVTNLPRHNFTRSQPPLLPLLFTHKRDLPKQHRNYCEDELA